MRNKTFGCRIVIAALLAFSLPTHAVTIVSNPVFEPSTKAPLAGLLTVTTDIPARVRVSVHDGVETWERSFYQYATNHSIPLLGFKPGRTNWITVTLRDRSRQTAAAPPLTFITSPLPANFPRITVLEAQPEKMEPGYTLCRPIAGGGGLDYLLILDNSGDVVWYDGNSVNGGSVDIRQLENGNLFYATIGSLVELNLLGDTVRTWTAAPLLPIDVHDGYPTSRGTLLYLSAASRVVTNYPTSTTNPNAPTANAQVKYNRVVEISATNGALLQSWSLIDLLDPDRIDYLSQIIGGGWDSQHANAVIEDTRDDSIIVSLRNQDAVIKFSRATGRLQWILGPHENWSETFDAYLLKPVGAPFHWNYGQHAPMITPQGTLLLYDNGNYRASPFDPYVADVNNYSRAVEFRIDEERMEVSQVWEYTGGANDRLYTGSVGDANWLPRRQNVLITFGAISYANGAHPSRTAPNALMARIKEVTHDPFPEVVFDVAVFNYTNTSPTYAGNWIYRSVRIPDLYAHPAVPVTDLVITLDHGSPRLGFSADPARAYFIETSADLIYWEEAGEALLEGNGEFAFVDESAEMWSTRYYRVVSR